MNWIELITQISLFLGGTGISGIIFWSLNRRQKKGEVEKLEIDVRKLQDVELRERASQLVSDLSDANETIKRISGELQRMIDEQAEKDIKIARLAAENKVLRESACKKSCTCLNFEIYDKINN